MNTFGEWWNPLTWGQDSGTSTDTSSGSFTGASNDLFGFNLPNFDDVVGGVSDSTLNQWQNYWNNNGVMGANLTGTVGTGGSTTGDVFSGISDFLNNALSALPNLAQTGLGIYASVQKLVNEQNPSDRIVTLPGSKTPVIERTQNGSTTYIPFVQAYPGLVSQVNQAQQSSQWVPLALFGVLGLGLIFILKKK
jgi:hypothetical protein